jgi:telomerase Cajal body protein 1
MILLLVSLQPRVGTYMCATEYRFVFCIPSILITVLICYRHQPIHLLDAYTGTIRASYRPYNALDEMESPTVVAFANNGAHVLAAGFRTDRVIHQFDIHGGRDSTIWRLGKTRRSRDGQKGLVSAVSATSHHLFCVGTYAPGSIYIYDVRMGLIPSGTILDGVAVVGHGNSFSRKKRRFVEVDDTNWISQAKGEWFQRKAHSGVTQLQLSSDSILYSASRRSNTVLAWDLRMMSGHPDYSSQPIHGFASYWTDSDTNQKLEFDVDERNQRIYVCGRDGCVRVYDLKSGVLIGMVEGLDDVANGVSFLQHEQLSHGLLAVATGSRRFPSLDDLDLDTVPLTSDASPGSLYLLRINDAVKDVSL